MADLKLVSMRLDEDVLSLVSKAIENRPYFSRSSFINKLLKTVLECSSPDDVSLMVDSYDPYGEGVSVRAFAKK